MMIYMYGGFRHVLSCCLAGFPVLVVLFPYANDVKPQYWIIGTLKYILGFD